jgi:hypothetical protein
MAQDDLLTLPQLAPAVPSSMLSFLLGHLRGSIPSGGSCPACVFRGGLGETDTWLITVGELDAGLLERSANRQFIRRGQRGFRRSQLGSLNRIDTYRRRSGELYRAPA